MSRNSRVLPRRAKESAPLRKTAAVRAVADSTQERIDDRRKSTRLRKRKASETDSSDDSNQVSESRTRRRAVVSKQCVGNDRGAPKQQEAISRMGRRIPLTFTAQGKMQCEVIKTGSSNVLPFHSIEVPQDDGDVEDSNVLMREWLERKANKGNLAGLQWYDKSRRMVKISWKHGSKSCWTHSDSQVFISWARCTGSELFIAVTSVITVRPLQFCLSVCHMHVL